MNRREFLATAAAIPLARHTMALASYQSGQSRVLHGEAHSIDAATESGPDLSRFRLTLYRVLHGVGPAYTPEFLLEDVRATPGRRFTNYCGDLSGRWIGALSASAATFGNTFPILHDVVKSAIALQHRDGYFGGEFHYDHPDDNDLALLWGNGRLLVGLMEYYALTHDPAVLISARKLGDFLVRIGPRFNSQPMADAFSADHFASSYICWTQQTEGLAALHAVTREDRYRELCAAISSRIRRRPGDHVHGYLSSLRGTLELYQSTGDVAYLNQVVGAWRDIQHSGDLLLTGGVPERWTPKRERTEGCAECDWLRLNLALYRATGDSVYLDVAQDTYFNEFSMNQFATGDFGHARLNPQGTPETVYVRAWWCCTLHGLRTFADIQSTSFRVVDKAIFFDFPIDSEIRLDTIVAKASSRLATEGIVQIDIRSAASDHKLTILQPSWADNVTVARNGVPMPSLTVDTPAGGDVILIHYGMKLQVTSHDFAGSELRFQSLRFGPWLLGISSRANPEYFNELYANNLFDLATCRRSGAKETDLFDVPQAESTIRCTPAEYPEQRAEVELRAIATQTASRPETWQLLLATESARKLIQDPKDSPL